MVTAQQILNQLIRIDVATVRINDANNRINTALNQIPSGPPGGITDAQAQQILDAATIIAGNTETQADKSEANAIKAESKVTP